LDNKLTCFPEVITKLTKLKELSLSKNQIAEIPQTIEKLQDLEVLNFRDNKLSCFPETITRLKKLKVLKLSKNKIVEIPEAIKKLEQLEELDLSSNRINKIPDEVSFLENLHALNLQENNLREIPARITRLRKDLKLTVSENPIHMPPLEIAISGMEAIENYFNSMQQGASEELFEVKLNLVGEGSVGKTCVAKKLKDKSHQIAINEISTEGIDIEKMAHSMRCQW